MLKFQATMASPGTIYVPEDYEKIQWAIGNATAGDTVRVHAGSYYEHVVVDKQLSLIGDGRGITTIDGGGVGPVVNITASGVVMTGFTIRNSSVYAPIHYGIVAEESTDCQITDNSVEDCGYGITMDECSDFSIVGNVVTRCDIYCIILLNSSDGLVADNTLFDFLNYGITLTMGSDNNIVEKNGMEHSYLWGMSIDSKNDVIRGNKFVNCDNGIMIGLYTPSECGNNTIYHNSFVNITNPVYESASLLSSNTWDLGWPNGGNYWSDHDNTDVKSGPNQLGPGSDGISDTAYEIQPSGSFDNAPCAGSIDIFDAEWHHDSTTTPVTCEIVSNSTVTDFGLDSVYGIIKFNVEGSSGTGFSRLDVPDFLVGGMWQNSYKVLVDGVPIDFGNWSASGKTYIYFRYAHSIREIAIAPEGDEYFNNVVYTKIVDSGDLIRDVAVEVAMDVDTSYGGILNVEVLANLIFPNGTNAASNSTVWSITDADVEWGNFMLYVPPDSPVGNYSVELFLYDDAALEDYRMDTIYLVGSLATLIIEVNGNGTTYPEPGWHHFPKIGVCVVEAFPDPGWMLDHWLLDETNVGSDNPIPVDLDADHNLTAVFMEIPPDMRELTIEVAGSGTTDPAPGTHMYSVGTVVFVDAIPDAGWMLDHWLLNSVVFDPDDPFPVTMDDNHVLVAVFAETPPLEAVIESCDPAGDQKDLFDLGEIVYVTGGNYSPSTTYNFSIVVDVETWSDGMAIPERVPGTATTISSNIDGNIPPTAVWSDPQTVGKYDIVVDVNGNGQYDAGIDVLDDNDVEVTAGFSVIPEFPSFIIPQLFMMAALLAVAVHKSRSRKGNTR